MDRYGLKPDADLTIVATDALTGMAAEFKGPNYNMVDAHPLDASGKPTLAFHVQPDIERLNDAFEANGRLIR